MIKLSKEYLGRCISERIDRATGIVPRIILVDWKDKNRMFCYCSDEVNMQYVKYKSIAKLKELDSELCEMIYKYESL